MFSAKTRLPRDLSLEEVESVVEDVLEMLKLTEIQNSIIGDEGPIGKE
jgi:hypothetical protein